MRTSSPTCVPELQKHQKNIRNICILAHVDHGKTTLADSLLASNGIISKKMAGKLRYLDSRKDEQERGITMKSSAVSITYTMNDENYLINLIDSPGHVDFSGEVSTAVRLSDGAIIVVDVIEGVCPQTKFALRQAWMEHIQPVLVLNKIDRLILERKLTPLDAHIHLQQVLEQVNAVMGELFNTDILGKSEQIFKALKNQDISNAKIFDWNSGLEETDDSLVYFSPDRGNVVFASALDGWGFCTAHFAKLYANKLGVNEEVLRKTLWGDYYLNMKTKRIIKGAQAKAKKPLFVQFILENVWAVYEAVVIRRDKEMTEKIVKTLNLQLSPRDINHTDAKVKLQALYNQWLPVANAVLEMVCLFLPDPSQMTDEKVRSLICSSTHRFDSLPLVTQNLKKYFLLCSSSDDVPVIVYVSKMFPVEKKLLPQNRQRPLTSEEITQRREHARHTYEKKIAETATNEKEKCDHSADCQTSPREELLPYMNHDDTILVAFARVFSGTLRKNQKLYVLGPKHDPAKALKEDGQVDARLTLKDLRSDQHITVTTIKDLYLLMGKELVSVEEVPAGNVLGIGGLEEHVLKTATISSTVACPPFVNLNIPAIPIIRVALEAVYPVDMPALVHGMKLLNQADPCVQVFIQESGEHVLVTTGEVHLQRCIDDLTERFAKIQISVSPPIVPFRETVVPAPKVDMVNEAIELKQLAGKSEKVSHEHSVGLVELKTQNKQGKIKIRAVSLPEEVTKLLEQNSALLKDQDQAVSALHSGEGSIALTEETLQAIEYLRTKLQTLFIEAGPQWAEAVDCIWSFGPRRCGPNILLNKISHYKRPSVWITCQNNNSAESPLCNYDSSFISGFQLATLAGPLCEEPMMGICFIVEDWQLDVINQSNSLNIGAEAMPDHYANKLSGDNVIKDSTVISEKEFSDTSSLSSCSVISAPFGPFTGQIMSTVKEGCRRAFQAQAQRLMAAMYSCNIQVTTDVLGKMYAVLGRRHGRVLHADMQEGSQTFNVTAVLPVVESFDFANEIRKQTSGMASPQLFFSHWEVVVVDPFWVPRTEEEYMHFGEKADTENRALKYVNNVRRRKGLPVDEKIVQYAEKQRTLTKKK